MKLPDLGQLAKNRTALLAGGAAVAVGAGLYQRKKAASVGGTAAAPAAAASTPAGSALPYSVGGQRYPMSGAGGVYDSSASDLYGAVAPQLESISSQLNDLRSNGSPPIPVPAVQPGVYRWYDGRDQSVNPAYEFRAYRVFEDGTADLLENDQFGTLHREGTIPMYETRSPDDPIWSKLKYVGGGFRPGPTPATPAS